MISIKELHGEDAWRYLMESVTDAQGDLREAASITRYYTDSGTPPGRWLGTGLAVLGDGAGLAAGSMVTGEQMQALFGDARDPITGQRLGRAFPKPKPHRERVAVRVRRLPPGMDRADRDAAVEAIKAEEKRRRVRHAVYGFDYTFSPPKSVSALWAVADQGTRELIVAAHHAAIDDVLALVERDVARTRIGTDGVAQVGVRGVLAAAFDHYDSREHDPQLHTHVVIANKVQAEDGKWRTLDSRGVIFPSAVAMSETYDNLLADHLTRRLGVGWEVRDPGRKMKNAKWEITGVPTDLIDAFSTRRDQIEAATDDLVTSYRAYTGREPDDATKLKLRQRATRQTRREKTVYPLATLSQFWRAKASQVLNADPRAVLDQVGRGGDRVRLLRADDFTGPRLTSLVDEVMARLHESRSTWSVWNIRAEAARATMKYRLATAADRDVLHQRLVEHVTARSLLLTPPPAASTPAAFRRADGTSVFTPEYGAAYTSRALLDAEARLLEAARAICGPAVEADTAERVLTDHKGRIVGLGEDQAAAVWSIATSGRSLDVLVGAAGAGKTTALAALLEVWETQHGPGLVVGLAPTAKAAELLADTLGIGTENTAKWLTEHALNTDRRQRLRALLDRASTARHRGNRHASATATVSAVRLREQISAWELHPGQLLIVDEASMSGTLALDKLTRQAEAAGAKVLLVGDWAQLSAVESGGAFRMLVNDRSDPPELSTVRRFTYQWERTASLRLRVGDTTAIDTYLEHNRVRDGDTDTMLHAAYAAWAADEQAGLRSLLIADTNNTVAELNTRARADRNTWGEVESDGVRLHDGTLAGLGDRIVTRKIDRALTPGPRSWVKNGDQWTVLRRFDDGSLTVRRAKHDEISPVITLPAAYVVAHVELAYATTAHRTQGDTVDTAHALVREQMSREVLYVAMTRGREANTAYVTTEPESTDDEHQPEDAARTVRDVLEQVLARSSAEASAHETLVAEHERVHSIAQLAAEYDTLAREARKQHWAALTEMALPGVAPDDVAGSPSWPVLVTTWRRAEAAGLDTETAAQQLAQTIALTDGDPVAMLQQRIEIWAELAAPRHTHAQAYIVGLIPTAVGVSDDDIAQALAERAALIEARAAALVERALTHGEPWIAELGPPPNDPVSRLRWEQAAATVAAYRERHGVTDAETAFGQPADGGQWSRRADRHRAHHALLDARKIAIQPTRPNSLTGAHTAPTSPSLEGEPRRHL